MEFAVYAELLLFVVLLGLSGFFSSSETSLFSLNSTQLQQMQLEKHPKLGLIQQLLSEPRRLIVTILIGNEFVNVAASVISAAIIIELFGAENKFINLFVMVPILLLFGEITPKTLAIRNNVRFAALQAGPIELFARLITPLRWLVRNVSEIFITLIVGSERSRGNIVTEDMLRTLAHEAVGEGALDHTEAQFIDQIFEFGDLTLEDVMTPRADIHFLPIDTSMNDLLSEVRSSNQSRLPVFDTHRDNIIGILHTRDLLRLDFLDPAIEKLDLATILREPYFVPESKRAADQFDDFRNKRRSFALTVDEYGGVTGLVTMEDLLECIFGDLPSPSDVHRSELIEASGQQRWQVDGSLSIEDFNAHFEAHLGNEVVETIGGLVLHHFGELPDEGESLDIEPFRFRVESMENNRIRSLAVERLHPPLEAPGEGARNPAAPGGTA